MGDSEQLTKARRLTRRKLVAAGAGALPALGFSRYLRAAPRRVEVAIIGGGLAGLNAGMILQDLGASVLVLEANTRTGGRCLTADHWLRTPDLGGSQVGGTYARVQDMTRRLGIELAPGAHINAPYTPVIDGQMVPPDAWRDSPLNLTVGEERDVLPHALLGHYVGYQRSPFKNPDDWMSAAARQYDVSIAQWLRQQGASEEAMRLINEYYGSISLEDRGVLRVLQETTRGGIDLSKLKEQSEGKKDVFQIVSTNSFRVVGGTSRLTDAMTAQLGDRVQMGHAVVSIDQNATGCSLRLSDGSYVEADYVIAAVPFSVLRRIEFGPELTGVQAEAVKLMPYGNQSQVWLEVKEPYWEQDGLDASMWTDGRFSLIRQQIEADGTRVLISALSLGEKSKAIDAMPPEERGRFAIAEIERIRPSTRGKLAFVGAHSWEEAPYSRGCSFQMLPGRVVDWANGMGRPHGRVHFAGEHLRRLELGMEAAMETGERAAVEIAERMVG